MEIIDLTEKYYELVIKKKSPEKYISLYPLMFEHYFEYWASNKVNFINLTNEEIQIRKLLILKSIKKAEYFFENNDFNISNIKIVLFVGNNATNGHVFMNGLDVTVFIPIESYQTSIYSDVFCIHEIIHAIHYSLSPEFYFKDKAEKENMSRNLISEGIATYCSGEILKINNETALWADVLSANELTFWMNECEQKCNELFEYCRVNYNNSCGQIFSMIDIKDIFKSRGGYWTGLMLISKFKEEGKNIDMKTLLTMPRNEFEKKIYKML